MKKLVLFVTLLFVALGAQAQIGLKGGINLGAFAEENTHPTAQDFKNEGAPGWVAGITFDMDVSDVFTIQPELLFIQKGSKTTYSVFGFRTEQLSTVNYVELPIMAKLRFGNTGKDGGVGFFVGAGPWAGYALNGKYKVSSFDPSGTKLESYEESYTFDDQDNWKRVDWGLSGGAGLVIGRLVLEGRYNYGINNLLDSDANNNNDNGAVLQTRGLSLTLGVTL